MAVNSKEREWSWYLGIIFIVFFILLYFQLIDDKLSYIRGADNANYVLLAKALASGLGFSDINLPGTPPHTQYPPIFSIILAPVIFLFGYNFMWMRLLVIGSALGSLYFAYRYFSVRLPKAMAFVLVFLTGTSFFVLTLSAEILPELVYLFFTMLALFLFDRNLDSAIPTRYARYLPIIIPVVYFTKFIGVTLCFAVILVLALRIKSETEERSAYIKKFVSYLVIGVVPFILWFIRNSIYSKGVSSYQSIMFQADYYDASLGQAGLSTIFERAAGNISMYFTELPMTFITYLDLSKTIPSNLLKALLLVILVLTLIGLLRDIIIKREVKDFYTLSFLAILMVWPTYGSGDARRYLVPLVPLLYYYFFRGFEVVISPGTFLKRGETGLRSGITGNRAAWLVIFPASLFIIFNLAQIRGRIFSPTAPRQIVRSASVLGANLFTRVDTVELDQVTTGFFMKYVPCYHNYLEGAALLRAASAPGDIVMTRKPEVVSLLSGRRTVRFPFITDEHAFFKFVELNKVTHILLDNCYKETKRYVLPVTEKYGERFTIWVTADGSHSGILKLNVSE
jgi:hypothetical protein